MLFLRQKNESFGKKEKKRVRICRRSIVNRGSRKREGGKGLDDKTIILLFYERSEQAIIELAAKYGAVCLKLANNILNNPMDAEECVNDAYLGAWNTIPPNHPDALLAYVCRIVRNISIMKYHKNTALKRSSTYTVALDELEATLASKTNVEEELSAKELSGFISRFLDTLDQKNRILFVRRYWYADSIADLAMHMKLSENSVSVRLLRIRRKLKLYLKKEGYEL